MILKNLIEFELIDLKSNLIVSSDLIKFDIELFTVGQRKTVLIG
jgi:hypothetical protein